MVIPVPYVMELLFGAYKDCIMDITGSWNNGFWTPCYKPVPCCCCLSPGSTGIKGAGCVPCCCPNFLCPCMPMMWASAMSQIKGKEYNYMACCLGAQCCPICTFGYAMMELGPHYGIPEPTDLKSKWYVKCNAPVLTLYQVFDTVLRRENLHIVVAGVAPDAGAPPTGEAMQR